MKSKQKTRRTKTPVLKIASKARRKLSAIRTKSRPKQANPGLSPEGQLWEVFVQGESPGAHEHAGSVHATDARMALLNARDVYSRRGVVRSIWVVPANQITASASVEAASFFEPGNDKVYRHPQFYSVPRGIRGF